MRSPRVLAALAVTATAAQAQSVRHHGPRGQHAGHPARDHQRHRGAAAGRGAAGHDHRGAARGAAPDLRGRRLRSAPPHQRHRGPRAGPGSRLRVGCRDPRLLVRPLVRRAADDRRRADQSARSTATSRATPTGAFCRPPAVSSLRVITGPASPLYGDFSLAGVVEVFTAADAAGTRGSVTGSSYGDAGGWVRSGDAGRSRAASCWRARAGDSRAGATTRPTGWGTGRVRGWRRAGTGRLEGGVSLYGSSWDSPGFVSASTDYNADRLTGAMDPTDGGSAYRGIAHGRFTTVSGETGIEATAWVQRVHSGVFLTIPEDGALDQSDEEDRRTAVGGRFQVSRPIGAGDLSAGLDGRADFAALRPVSPPWRARARLDARPTTRGTSAAARSSAGARWSGTRVALDLGARADGIHYRTLDRLAGTAWRSRERPDREPQARRALLRRRRLVARSPRSARDSAALPASSATRRSSRSAAGARRSAPATTVPRVTRAAGAVPPGRLARADPGSGDARGAGDRTEQAAGDQRRRRGAG